MRNTKEYKAIKNFIHNELGLTKEDFKGILVAAMQDEARSFARNTLKGTTSQQILDKAINTEVSAIIKGSGYAWERSRIADSIGSALARNIEVTIKK